MQEHSLGGHLGRTVVVDVCEPCQSIWFDGRESLQLTPGATLALFRLIGEHASRPQLRDGDAARCPRCGGRLRRTKDMQRTTRFEYFRCPNGHGRLISFLEFLKEKDFIRPLTPHQLKELRQHLRTVNCSNCGAPVDLVREAACAHCRSPLSMIDWRHAGQLVAELQDAERTDKPAAIDPALLPLELARARRTAEAAFRDMPGQIDWSDASSSGLVAAGLHVIARWLRGG